MPADYTPPAKATSKRTPGQLMRKIMPDDVVANFGLWHLKRRKAPGRMYSFLAQKPATGVTAEH